MNKRGVYIFLMFAVLFSVAFHRCTEIKQSKYIIVVPNGSSSYKHYTDQITVDTNNCVIFKDNVPVDNSEHKVCGNYQIVEQPTATQNKAVDSQKAER